MVLRVIRINQLASTKSKKGLLPVSPATIWRWVQFGKFPKPYKLGERVTVWDMVVIEKFIANKGSKS
jgi:prophage regulatory protein